MVPAAPANSDRHRYTQWLARAIIGLICVVGLTAAAQAQTSREPGMIPQSNVDPVRFQYTLDRLRNGVPFQTIIDDLKRAEDAIRDICDAVSVVTVVGATAGCGFVGGPVWAAVCTAGSQIVMQQYCRSMIKAQTQRNEALLRELDRALDGREGTDDLRAALGANGTYSRRFANPPSNRTTEDRAVIAAPLSQGSHVGGTLVSRRARAWLTEDRHQYQTDLRHQTIRYDSVTRRDVANQRRAQAANHWTSKLTRELAHALPPLSAPTTPDVASTLTAQSPPAQSPPAQSPPAQSPPAQSPPAQSPPAQSPPAQSPPAQSPPAQSPPPAQSSPAQSPLRGPVLHRLP